MAFYSPPCRVQHCFPAPGPFAGQGPQCFGMNPMMCMSRNPPPFAPWGPEPCEVKCDAKHSEPCAPKSSGPCDAKSVELCDAKGDEKCASPSASPGHEPCSIGNRPPQLAERCNLPCPPHYMPPPVSWCPPPGGPPFGAPQGSPISSRCFPPRKMYQYTTSKTFKSCYAK